jgi:1-acyl-sn-glycerol-3-phosphate acyltransferase
MAGYFRSPDATDRVFREGWVDTGDLGYLSDGELFVTSRRKDVIIKGGRNLYPQEIEEITGSVAGVRRGCVAAFGIADAKTGTERLVVVAETREMDKILRERLAAEIVARVDSALGIPPDLIELVSPQEVPKTSSGKIRRDACRNLYLHGKLGRKRLPAWLQLAKIVAKSSKGWVNLWLERSIGVAYGCYVWIVFVVLFIPAWPVIMFVPSGPSFHRSNQILRFLCRTWLWFSGLAPKLEGMENLVDASQLRTGEAKSLLLVSNHASYIDPIVLVAAMPFDIRFVAKQEAARWPVIGTFIRKCGALTISRNDPSQTSEDSEKITLSLKEGTAVHMFPEGTFTAHTGLRPFQMGAFKAVVETGSRIVPVTLSGTRKVLRDRNWLPRWGRIRVVVSRSMQSREKNWQEMVRIRDSVRVEILRHSGEGSLNLVRAGLSKE